MKVTYLVFNPYTLEYALEVLFNNESKLHMSITTDAAMEMKKRNAIEREPENGKGQYTLHMLYWKVL